MSKPKKVWRVAGGISLAHFENENGSIFSLQKGMKMPTGEWKATSCFFPGDLIIIRELISKAINEVVIATSEEEDE